MYKIITDANCDLPDSFCKENDIEVMPMSFTICNKTYNSYLDFRELDIYEFYDLLSKGNISQTHQLTQKDILDYYTRVLDSGYDILGLCFSSGLSGSFNLLRLVVDELKEKYKDRKILIIDTLSACMGQGLVVYKANEFKKQGLTLEENYNKISSLLPNFAQWFTINDIEFLRRGGRVSNVQAFIAKTIAIKPILHVDNFGKLIPMIKKIGRKNALISLCNNFLNNYDPKLDKTLFICHGNSLKDANFCKDYILSKNKDVNIIINIEGPVIASHTGSGMIGLFYMGKKR